MDSRIKTIETFCDFQLDEMSTFHVYIGCNIPKETPEDEQQVITVDELDRFFELQEIFTGLTRIPCTGMWKGELEASEAAVIFEVTLREVMSVFLKYIELYHQDAVYIDIPNSRQIILKKGDTNDTAN